MRSVARWLTICLIAALAVPAAPAAAQDCRLFNNCTKPKPKPAPPKPPQPRKPRPSTPPYRPPAPIYTPPAPPPSTPPKSQIQLDFDDLLPKSPVALFPNDDNTMTVDRAATITAAYLRNSQFRYFKGIAGDKNGFAVFGMDVVASRDQNKPVYGYVDTVVAWRGALWRFASTENMRKFIADPDTYMPAYNGFCAYCLAQNVVTSGKFVTVYKGLLFFFFNEADRTLWLADPDAYIRSANANFNTNLYTGDRLPQDQFSLMVSTKLAQ